MDYIIVDLEATCWEHGSDISEMEIIEIGAVRLSGQELFVSAEFSRFVRPTQHPILSEFCKQLTSIPQERIDQANPFPFVFSEFLDWIGHGEYTLCSWGNYDLRQFRAECDRHGIPFPSNFTNHINIKREFSRLHKTKECGMKSALQLVGLPLHGVHHRGIDDARNIAILARLVLPFMK
jgi:inhibitor of KinA sporulation pathway (predicted exonuclease)